MIVSVINDLATDQRVQRSCSVLQECGYTVLLVGRRLQNSPSVAHLPYKTKRMNMVFTKGPLFYFFFNLRLFFVLLFNKSHLLFANDLDTLGPNYRVSKLKNVPLIYDSHELFCEVPELQANPAKKRIWEKLEERIVPKLKYCITVNRSIAAFFEKKYKTPFHVVRNIPSAIQGFKPKSRQEMKLPSNKKLIIFQGAGINIDRGAEELVEAMQFVNDAHLFIIGGGDVFPYLRKRVSHLNLYDRITIIDKLPKQELLHYTFNADLGISLDKDTNLNYHFSLPNKLFDYIQAGIPVLASRLPEIENIVQTYKIGSFIESHEPAHIAQKINEMLDSPELYNMKLNTRGAGNENTWEKEKLTLKEIILNVK